MSDSVLIQLYDRYAAIFFNLFFRLTGDRLLAEEMLAHLFEELKLEMLKNPLRIQTDFGGLLCMVRSQLAQAEHEISLLNTSEGLIFLATKEIDGSSYFI